MCAVKRLSIEERKNEIMQSATRLITEKGFSNMTMEDVIAGTTMSKGVYIIITRILWTYLRI